MNEYTLALIKPDAWERKIVGELLSGMEAVENIRFLAATSMTLEDAETFYGRQHAGKPYFELLCDFMCSGNVIVVVLEGNDVIKRWREKLIELRFRYGITGPGPKNLLHGSDSEESFIHETESMRIHVDLYT